MRTAKFIIRLAAVFVGAGIVLGSCMRSDPSGDVGNGRARGEAVDILALDNSFEPSTIEAEAGEEITVQIENIGDSAHDFEIEELDVNTGTIGSGKLAHATFEVPDGTTEFVCSYHGGMSGRIVGV
jgi:plastocyanin